MSMFRISCFHSHTNLTLRRQVPGLQPKKSGHKKRGVSSLENRTRPDLVERILAQRARRAEINANNQERLFPPNPVQQSPAAQQMSNTEAGGSRRGSQPGSAQQAKPNIQPNPHRQVQSPHPWPQQAQQSGRSIVGGDEDDSEQPPQAQCSGKERSEDEEEMDAEEEKDQARCREVEVEELARQQGETAQLPVRSPRQPQKVGFTIPYLDSTHIGLGSHGLGQCTYRA